MAASGRMLNTDVNITWDGVPVRLARGTIIDTPVGGGLETAIGTSNLTSLDPEDTGQDPGGDQTESEEAGSS